MIDEEGKILDFWLFFFSYISSSSFTFICVSSFLYIVGYSSLISDLLLSVLCYLLFIYFFFSISLMLSYSYALMLLRLCKTKYTIPCCLRCVAPRGCTAHQTLFLFSSFYISDRSPSPFSLEGRMRNTRERESEREKERGRLQRWRRKDVDDSNDEESKTFFSLAQSRLTSISSILQHV